MVAWHELQCTFNDFLLDIHYLHIWATLKRNPSFVVKVKTYVKFDLKPWHFHLHKWNFSSYHQAPLQFEFCEEISERPSYFRIYACDFWSTKSRNYPFCSSLPELYKKKQYSSRTVTWSFKALWEERFCVWKIIPVQLIVSPVNRIQLVRWTATGWRW